MSRKGSVVGKGMLDFVEEKDELSLMLIGAAFHNFVA